MKLYELFIALRYMTSNKRQSLIIAGAVGIGVSLIIFVPSINLSFFNDLIDKTVTSSPHITITKELETFQRDIRVLNREVNKNLLLVDQTETRRRNIRSYREVIKEIQPISEITTAAPYASGQGILVKGAEERGISIKGIIPEEETKITNIKNDIIKGRIDPLGTSDIVIGKRLAEKINVDLNDRITIIGPRGVNKTFKVAGIFSTGLRSSEESQIYIALKQGQQLLDLGTDVTGVGVKVKDIYQAENVAQRIKAITGLEVRSWMEDNKQILEQVERFKLIISFLNFLIMAAAASSITSVFTLLIASKAKEIGILKSMGSKNLSIMSIFLSQSLILSLIGFIGGILGARLLIAWYTYILSSTTETFLTTSIPVIKINTDFALLAFFYSILMSILASSIPAYQAAKLNPVETINA